MFKSPTVVDVREGYVRRIARLAMGITLLVGAWSIATAALGGDASGIALTFALTWLGGIAMYGLAYSLAFTFLPWAPPRTIPRWLDHASIATVFTGAALLLPFTLHLAIAGLFGRVDGFRAFDGWVEFALPLTGLGHLVGAILVAVRACRLVAGQPVGDAARIIIWSGVASALPTFVFVVMPPAIVIPLLAMAIAMLTGMATFPAMLKWLDASVARDAADRAAIGTLPAAIVHRAA